MAESLPEPLTSLLKEVSQSIYLTLRILSGAIRPQIGLACLLARATDGFAPVPRAPKKKAWVVSSWPKLQTAAIVLFPLHFASAQTSLAFPGAEGFGWLATGGRGGEIVHVTSLDDSGINSFRDAVSKPHRTLVFDVGGVIRLKSNLAVSSDLTIQGQTAPGEGVTLYGHSVSF